MNSLVFVSSKILVCLVKFSSIVGVFKFNYPSTFSLDELNEFGCFFI